MDVEMKIKDEIDDKERDRDSDRERDRRDRRDRDVKDRDRERDRERDRDRERRDSVAEVTIGSLRSVVAAIVADGRVVGLGRAPASVRLHLADVLAARALVPNRLALVPARAVGTADPQIPSPAHWVVR
ncbi:hypothetical protein PHLGIDRAFT_460012 [Phlebiopsis gigantea 11061_1 CR5-6]|uniref:Uncharacterized protein n=1 Tax=Phlebiopsis gigantea (strain 11061_1 CR5-6) TaxID=745531 RepID=A0A0C3S6Z4_PHLG1|nr:hypothetical protein PHLGIDRAFT_460012 [Phlebiopsis gigantea 11061_1 CR5-6]